MVVHVLLIDGFLAPRLIFPSGASRPIGNIRTHRMRVETIFGGLPCRRSLTPRVSPSRAPVLSFAYYFQAPATQASNWIVAGKRFSWASRSRVSVSLPSRVSFARPVLPALYSTSLLLWLDFCNRLETAWKLKFRGRFWTFYI